MVSKYSLKWKHSLKFYFLHAFKPTTMYSMYMNNIVNPLECLKSDISVLFNHFNAIQIWDQLLWYQIQTTKTLKKNIKQMDHILTGNVMTPISDHFKPLHQPLEIQTCYSQARGTSNLWFNFKNKFFQTRKNTVLLSPSNHKFCVLS